MIPGNASQLSDGASACVLMEEQEAIRLGLEPLGAFVGCVFNCVGVIYIVAVGQHMKQLFLTLIRICGCYSIRFAVGGCSPEEMGVGPTVAVPKLLSRYNLTVDDIDLWELNEAFAVVPLHCADVLGIDHEKMNVNGGKAYVVAVFLVVQN